MNTDRYDQKNPDELATFAALRYGRVLEVLNSDGSQWSSFASDGFVKGCRVKECDADGERIDRSGTWLLRVSAEQALLGVRQLAVDDVVAWWPGDRTESFSTTISAPVDGYLQSPAGASQISIAPVRDSFWAKITASHSLSINRWAYEWVEQKRVGNVFQDVAGGRVSGIGHRAINTIETNNTSSGVQGNGIDISATDFPDGYSLQPVQGEPVVMMYQDLGTGDSLEFSFSYVNAVDGSCD